MKHLINSFVILLSCPVFFYAQDKRCKITSEEFQYISWALPQEYYKKDQHLMLKTPVTNNIFNSYLFTYTPIFRSKENCLIGYAVKLENKNLNTIRYTCIPYDNNSEFENLFNEIMGWTTEERNAFIKSYLIFENTTEGKL